MKTRLIKTQCGHCGYIARVTRRWIADVGAPLCPCKGEPMELPEWQPEVDEAPAYKVVRDRWVAIRKGQRCSGCQSEFMPGESMRSRAFTIDGSLTSEYVCVRCNVSSAGSREVNQRNTDESWREELAFGL